MAAVDPPAVVLTIGTLLRVAPSTVHRLSDSLIQDAVREAGLHADLAQRAALEQYVAECRAKTDALTSYFAAQEQRQLEPWRVLQQRLARERTVVATTPLEKLQLHFIALAKDRQLTTDEVMTATYTLFGSPESLTQYSAMVISRRGHDRVVAHNAFVMESLDAALLTAYGHRILKMPYPLFPSTPDFAHLNTRLLQSWSAEDGEAIGGESPKASDCSDMFRTVSQAEGAGTTLPVVQDASGAFVVDVTIVETAFDGLYRHLHQLSDELNTQKNAAEAGKTSTNAELKTLWERLRTQLAATKRDLGATQRTVHTAFGTSRQSGRGQGRGRGGGRGHGRARGF